MALQTLPIAHFPDISPPVVQSRPIIPAPAPRSWRIPRPYDGSAVAGIDTSSTRLDQHERRSRQHQAHVRDRHERRHRAGSNQNRIKLAEPQLPPEVVRQGISVLKFSPDLLAVVALSSSDPTHDTVFISNYALLRVIDNLKRLQGVGQAMVFGQQNYSMRLILDPLRMAQLGLTPSDIVNVVREQNRDFPAGQIGREPAPKGTELTSRSGAGTAYGSERLSGADRPRLVRRLHGRLKDVARVELGAQSYVMEGDGTASPILPDHVPAPNG